MTSLAVGMIPLTSKTTMIKHTYEYDEIVIGHDLSALFYSYFNCKPLILNSTRKPFLFDFLDIDTELEKIFMEPVEYEMVTRDEPRKVGCPTIVAWDRVCFPLSLAGLMPIADKVQAIRVEDNTLRVTTDRSRLVKYKFNKLTIFNDENVAGIGVPTEHNKRFKVIDWIDVRSGATHQFDYFGTEDDLAKEVYFYPSPRLGGGEKDKRKDCVSVSYMNKKDLDDFDFSDTMVRFKILKMMKEQGIRGMRNGRDKRRPGKYYYYAVKIEPRKREVIQLDKNKYENTELINYDYRTPEEILDQSEISYNYLWKINKHLMQR